MHPRLRNLLLTTAALLALGAAPAAGGPAGGTVVGGTATIQGQGGPAVIVNQSSSSAIIFGTRNDQVTPKRAIRSSACVASKSRVSTTLPPAAKVISAIEENDM